MRCRECDYPLWNIAPGPCPECGTLFVPSDFEFVPASVAFCCPECDQAYFGTAFNGHLMPTRFDCTSCSAPIHMDSMSVRPAADRPEALQVRGVPPCMNSEFGFMRKWLGTLVWSSTRPGALVAGVPLDRSLSLSIRFFLPVLLLASLGSAFPLLLLFGGLWRTRNVFTYSTFRGVFWSGMSLVVLVLGIWIAYMLWSAVVHVALLVTGNCRHGYSRTLSSLMFASGPLIVLAVPCLGLYCVGPFFPIWFFILGIFALRSGQELTTSKAVVANLIPLLALGILALGGFITLWMMRG